MHDIRVKNNKRREYNFKSIPEWQKRKLEAEAAKKSLLPDTLGGGIPRKWKRKLEAGAAKAAKNSPFPDTAPSASPFIGNS